MTAERCCEDCGLGFSLGAAAVRKLCNECARKRRVARSLAWNRTVRAAFVELGLRTDGAPRKMAGRLLRAPAMTDAEALELYNRALDLARQRLAGGA